MRPLHIAYCAAANENLSCVFILRYSVSTIQMVTTKHKDTSNLIIMGWENGLH